MAEKMDYEKSAPLLLPVCVEKKKNQMQAAVRSASLWALSNASIMVVASVFTCTLSVFYPNPSDLPSWLQSPELTVAAEAKGDALALVYMWCCVLQSAAAAAALLLPGHRRRTRRALACVALAVTVASHCALAGASGILVAADTGDIFFWICSAADIFFFAAGDLSNLLALLRAWE